MSNPDPLFCNIQIILISGAVKMQLSAVRSLFVFYSLMVLLGPFIFTVVNLKKRLVITSIASYDMGSCHFSPVIAFPHNQQQARISDKSKRRVITLL